MVCGKFQIVWDTSFLDIFGHIWIQGTLKTYPRTYSGDILNKTLFDDSRAI